MKLYRFNIYILFCLTLFSCTNNSKSDNFNDSKGQTEIKKLVEIFEPSSIHALNAADIPASCKVEGVVNTVHKWKDKLGTNIFITAQTGEFETSQRVGDIENEELYAREAHVYAYHYLISEYETKLIRELHDFEDCGVFDLDAYFIPGTVRITDLNADNNAEIWMMYVKYCLSDMSPKTMKIIMFENGQKYALRGQSRVDLGNGEFCGGDFELDKAFSKGPVAFIDFAKQMWQEHIEGKKI